MSDADRDTAHDQAHALTDDRLSRVEERLEHVERLAMRVPAIESRISRIEKVMMEVQMDVRRLERTTGNSLDSVDRKLDLITTAIDRLAGTPIPFASPPSTPGK